jgi:hypothetical protein
VPVPLRDLPKYLVLDPVSTVRIDMRLDAPSCEIEVRLDNPRPGRSFVLLIGHPGGPYVQRVRLAGRAKIHFAPEAPGEYRLLLANPDREPVVLRLRGKNLHPATVRPTIRAARATRRRSAPKSPRRRRARSPRRAQAKA